MNSASNSNTGLTSLEHHFKALQEIFVRKENEKNELIKNQKKIENVLNGELTEVKGKLTQVKLERDQLCEKLKNKEDIIQQNTKKILKLEDLIKLNQRKYLDKAKSWKKFLNTVEKKCICGLAKKLKMSEVNSSLVLKDVSLTIGEVSELKSSDVELQTKGRSGRLFEKMPEVITIEPDLISPMTEQFEQSEVLSQNNSSTPIIGETELVSNVDMETDFEDSWKSSPSICRKGNQKHTKTSVKQSEVEFKIPNNFETPKRKLPYTYNTSAELFSDLSPNVPAENAKSSLKQAKISPNSWVTTSKSIPKEIQMDNKVNKNTKTKKDKYNIANDSFFDDSEVHERTAKPEVVHVDVDLTKPITLKTVHNTNSAQSLQNKALPPIIDVEKDESLDNLEDSAFFDRLLNRNGKPGYKFSEVVRKKSDREKLQGFDCEECRRYYESENLSEKELKSILKSCSRHRHQSTPPPSTPDEFWKIGFPDTQECKEKGYILDDDKELPEHVKPKWMKGNKKRIKYQ